MDWREFNLEKCVRKNETWKPVDRLFKMGYITVTAIKNFIEIVLVLFYD